MRENLTKLKNIFPETWTHTANINWLGVGFNLKLVGVDWRSEAELANCMAFMEKTGVIQRREMHLIRRTP
jgi:hypothetical protein